MESVSNYRGVAGEIVINFLRPGILFTAIPVILIVVVAAALLGLAPIPPAVTSLVLLAIVAALVGRFAIPAANGYYNEGFLSLHFGGRSMWGYAMRYLVALIVTGVPIWIGAMFAVPAILGAGSGGGMMGPSLGLGSLMGFGFAGVAMMVFLVAAVLGGICSYLLAIWADTPAQLFGTAPFEMLWWRRGDVLMFAISATGGVITFWLIYLIPLGVLVALLSAISSGLGATVGAFVISLPLALSPVLIGRLAGGFVSGQGHFNPNGPDQVELAVAAAQSAQASRAEAGGEAPAAAAPTPAADPAPAAAAAQAAATPAEPPAAAAPPAAPAVKAAAFDMDLLKQLIGEVKGLDENAMAAEEMRAGQAVSDDPENIAAVVKKGLIHVRKGEADAATPLMKLAITELLAERSQQAATQLYLACGDLRTRLPLDKLSREQLANTFRLQKRWLESAFCLYQAWLPTNPQNAQQKLHEIGQEALGAEAWQAAGQIFQFLLKRHPDTSFRGTAEQGRNKAAAEIKAQQAAKGG